MDVVKEEMQKVDVIEEDAGVRWGDGGEKSPKGSS